jgi:hypothetical protein
MRDDIPSPDQSALQQQKENQSNRYAIGYVIHQDGDVGMAILRNMKTRSMAAMVVVVAVAGGGRIIFTTTMSDHHDIHLHQYPRYVYHYRRMQYYYH